jgi:RNA polymerase sigma-70 factor (ECF subfamily)
MTVRALQAVPADDATLVERVRRGDESAFSALYERHARYLAGVLYRIMGHDAETDDILQETFVDAALQIGQLREPSQIRSWLVTIVVRRAHRALGARRRRKWFGLRVAEISPRCADPKLRQRIDELYEQLDRLSPDMRIPWVLHRIEDQGLADVAAACGVSLATAKRRIAAADERLNRRMHATG